MGDLSKRVATFGLGLVCVALAPSCSLDVDPYPDPLLHQRVGLDLDIINGTSKPLELLPGQSHYINQLRFQVNEKGFPAPEVLQWLQTQSEMSVVSWLGTTRVTTSWSESRGTFQEVRPYLHAEWMHERPSFRIEIYGDGDQPLAEPVMVEYDDYVIARQTAIVWIDGEPAKGDFGTNAGTYDEVAVVSGGTYGGAVDDIYVVEVVTAGPMDGTATVDVSSVRGDGVEGVAVQTGVPIALGSAGSGATIAFTDSAATPTELVEGDRWLVRCTAGEEPEVGAATPAPRASFSAVAEIRLQFPEFDDAEIFEIPDGATELRVFWSARPDEPYVIPVSFTSAPVGYGLDVHLTLSEPANGSFYVPGESIDVTVDMLDGNGNRLHDQDGLPTYREYITGNSNGIMYFKLGNDPSAGFFTENRLNLMRMAMYGPKHHIEQNYSSEESDEYFIEEVNLPDIGSVVIAGLAPGSTAWDTPISNHATFEIPENAEPGTYVVLAKTARSFLGERRYLERHVDVQVGTEQETHFEEEVGNCEVCHTADARLDRLRHAIAEASPAFCEPCHVPPNNTPIGVVVHRIHFYSTKYPVRKSGCSLCHLEPDSNERASIALCGACHGDIHPGENMEFDPDPYARCGVTCHNPLPPVHVLIETF